MSLLTEEQVLDLAEAMVDGNGTTYHRIQKWNEGQHIKYDLCDFLRNYQHEWDDEFQKPKKLELTALFYDENGNVIEKLCSSQERPTPVITPHPHAALIAKYAEVAARRIDPWAEFEMRIGGSSEWVKCDMPISFSGQEYRHIGETK